VPNRVPFSNYLRILPSETRT